MKLKADFDEIYKTLLAMDCTTNEGKEVINHFIKTESEMCEMGINTLRETIVKLNKKADQFHYMTAIAIGGSIEIDRIIILGHEAVLAKRPNITEEDINKFKKWIKKRDNKLRLKCIALIKKFWKRKYNDSLLNIKCLTLATKNYQIQEQILLRIEEIKNLSTENNEYEITANIVMIMYLRQIEENVRKKLIKTSADVNTWMDEVVKSHLQKFNEKIKNKINDFQEKHEKIWSMEFINMGK